MDLFNKKWIIAIGVIIHFTTVKAQQTLTLKDPTGKMEVCVKLDDTIKYSVLHEGDIMIAPSPISMELMDGTILGKSPRLKKQSRNTENNIITTHLYKSKTIQDNYNELILNFKGNYSLVFRAYEDGAAYRFITNSKDSLFVKNEQAVFNLPGNPKIYASTPKGRRIDGMENQYHSSFQNVYRHVNLSDWDKSRLAFLPVLSEGKDGKKVCITEADLLNYPGMFVNVSKGNQGFYGTFAAYPKDVSVEVRGLKGVVKTREPYIAKVAGKSRFPWRVIVVSEEDSDLLCNDMVYKLSTPAEGDYSWVKPGKVAWDWWNDWNIYGVDFRTGINTETYKYYIDFASRFGIEYVILDEGWAVPGPADLFQVVPEIDLKELIAYANKKNVGLILWAGYRAFDLDMERVCKHYSSLGIKGFKIDFMDRDDQYMVDFNHRCAKIGAKYKLLIDLHGTFKPTGLQRTYPNAINFEGVHGLEEMKWAVAGTDQVTYDVTMPFIRMLAGPLDYTQGAMNNANKKSFRSVYSEPMSQGTRCRQLAQYVIFDSPLNMLCDSPTNYLKEEECTKFIADIPTVWDETKVLEGKVGEYIAMARQKDGVWYIGAMTNWDEREMTLDLSFLESGNYQVEIFKDGVNADRVGKDYKRQVMKLPANKKVDIHMAKGGGVAIKIKKL